MNSLKNVTRFGLISVVLVINILLQSCSLKQTLFIDKTSAGNVSFELILASYFAEVAEKLSDLLPDDPEAQDSKEGIFNLDQIREDFSNDESVILKELVSPSREKLTGSLSFEDVTDVFKGNMSADGKGIFGFSHTGDIYTLSLELSYTTIERLLVSNPSMNSPLMESFGPLANKGLTDNDYLDMMQFALGDESRAGIEESFLLLDVNVDGKVVSLQGGVKLDEDTVRFRIPLLRILILDEPQSFSVSFTE